MTIVLPIFFAAVGFGLFASKMTPRLWSVLATWIALVLVYNYVKPMKQPAALPAGSATLPASPVGN